MRHLRIDLSGLTTRASDDGSAEFDGLAVPWNSPIVYAGVQEEFRRGSIRPEDAVNRLLLKDHKRDVVIGRIIDARDTEEGLAVTARISATEAGREVATLLRDQVPLGLSVGFVPDRTRNTAQGVAYEAATLHELSVVGMPAYGDARVTDVRDQPTTEGEKPMSEATDQREAPAVDLAPITERLDQIESRMTAAPEQVREIAPLEAFAMQLRDAVQHKQVRALGDVISSGNAGVLPPSWSSLLRGYLDGNRYLTPRLGSLGFPATGHTLTVPKITQEPSVGPRGTELTAIPGQSMTTSSDTYTAQWISGGVRLALELIEQSSPEASAVSVQRLLLAYNREVDDYLGTQLANAGTPTGSLLDFTSYGTFVDSVLDAAHLIRDNTGAFGDKLALTQESFKKLVGLVDADGRRVLSVSGPTNADGSTPLTSLSVSVGGVECFYHRGAEDWQFNSLSAAFSEKPPATLSEVEVGVMGRSIGVLGAVIALPLYPDGILVHSVA